MRLQAFARRLFQRLSWLAKPAGDHRVRRDALRRVCHLCVRQGCRLRRHARRLGTHRRAAHRIRCECHGRKAIRGAQRVAGLAEQGVHILRAHGSVRTWRCEARQRVRSRSWPATQIVIDPATHSPESGGNGRRDPIARRPRLRRRIGGRRTLKTLWIRGRRRSEAMGSTFALKRCGGQLSRDERSAKVERATGIELC